MSVDTSVTVEEFLEVRRKVGSILKSNSPQMRNHLEYAEVLIAAGVIDIDTALKEFRERKAREEERRLERETAQIEENRQRILADATLETAVHTGLTAPEPVIDAEMIDSSRRGSARSI